MANDKKQKIRTYLATNVMTAKKEDILLALYEAAIVSLKKAIKASEENNIQERVRFITKTQDIISELRASLNFSVGGSLAVELERLYIFVGQRLLEGSLDNNPSFFKEALLVLETLYSGWKEAIHSLLENSHQKNNDGRVDVSDNKMP